MTQVLSQHQGHRLIWFGVLLFLFGLLTGFGINAMASPRIGLSSHLEGVLNGMLLMVLGLIWPKMVLSQTLLKTGFGLALFGTYTNWGTTLLAAIWGAGLTFMPLSAGNAAGTAFQEAVIMTGLISLSIAMVLLSLILLWGLRSCISQNG